MVRGTWWVMRYNINNIQIINMTLKLILKIINLTSNAFSAFLWSFSCFLTAHLTLKHHFIYEGSVLESGLNENV